MILTFACKETEKIWQGKASRRFSPDIQDRALMKLRWLDASSEVEDLRVPSSNHLEVLRGNRKGQHSIRINRQWRICFVFKNGNAYEVEIVDYH